MSTYILPQLSGIQGWLHCRRLLLLQLDHDWWFCSSNVCEYDQLGTERKECLYTKSSVFYDKV